MPKSFELPPERLRLNVSSHLDLCKATGVGERSAGRQMRSSGVSVRDQARNLFIEHAQIPIN
jgi:hypothetical protein